MKISKSLLISLTFLIVFVQLLIKYYFFPDWFIFGTKGDDYQYHELMKIWDNAPFRIDGLVSSGQKNTFAYVFRYFIIKNPIVHSLLMLILFVYASVRLYYKLISLSLSYYKANVLYFLFLISPLKYVWLFSHYKEGILFVLILLFATNKFRNIASLTTFILRPILGLTLILSKLLRRNSQYRLLLLVSLIVGPLIIAFEYEWIWNIDRVNLFLSKIPRLTENAFINSITIIIGMLVLSVILPIFKKAGTSVYSGDFDSIVPLVNADFILNMPVSIMLLYNFRQLRVTQESLIYFVYVFVLLLSLMFLTNRHLLVVEVFKYLIIAQIHGHKKSKKGTGTLIHKFDE